MPKITNIDWNTQITRYGTVLLGAFQSFAAAVTLQNGNMVVNPGFVWLFTATITMTTGSMFLMWLGEQITERGRTATWW